MELINNRELLDRYFTMVCRQLIRDAFDNPEVPRTTVESDGNQNGGVGSTQWEFKTGEQIYRDVVHLIRSVREVTRHIEDPRILALPRKQLDLISILSFSFECDTTLLEFLLKTGVVEKVVEINELAGRGTNGTDMMVVYDPQQIQYYFGRIVILKPLSMRYGEGI